MSADITSAAVLHCLLFFACPYHQMYRTFHLMLTLIQANLKQNQRLEINQVCFHWLPTSKFVGNPMCIGNNLSVSPTSSRAVPFCDSWSQCVGCPYKIWSPDSCEAEALQNCLRTCIGKFFHCFGVILSKLMIVQTGCRNFRRFTHGCVCQLTMTFHVFSAWPFTS